MRARWHVIWSNDQRTLRQLAYESKNEFRGRALCEAEALVTGERLTPMPEGTRWAVQEDCYGYDLRESTGRPYSDRYRTVRGLATEAEAVAWVRG